MTARRVVVTGAAGLLGTWLRRTAPPDVVVVPTVHRRALADDAAASLGEPPAVADLRDPVATAAALTAARPDLVIHAAYALDRATIVDATEHVATAAASVGAEVVLVSTDAVFAGDGTPRAEGDRPDPVADYGRWKVAAEAAVAGLDRSGAAVRLPLIVSTDPDDAAVAAIRAGAQRGEPTGWFADELRQPARADELAAALWAIAALPGPERAGTWHLPGPERLSRHQIAVRVAATLGLDPSCVAATRTPADAVRPRDLWLTDRRAAEAIGWDPSPVLL